MQPKIKLINLKKTKSISHSSSGLEVQHQGTDRFGSLMKTFSLACRQLPSCCILPWQRKREEASSLASCLTGTLIPS